MSRDGLSENEKTVLDLTGDIKNLNRQKSNLTIECNELAKKNSKLSEEQIALEKKAKEIIETANIEAQKIKDDALSIYDKVKGKEKELDEKIGAEQEKINNLADLEKQAKDLIKSNEGLRGNLETQEKESGDKVEKLKSLISLINETLKNL